MPGCIFNPLGEEIWEHSQLVRFFGVWLPHRMTIVRLRDGSLFVHSPTRCDEATKRALKDIGPVAHIVAPNGMHDLFLVDYAAEFPEAQVWIPPGLDKYFLPLQKAERLPRDSDAVPWHEDLSHVLVEGVPRLNECVFFHPRSRSLICADLFFNIPKESPPLIRMAARLGGFYRKLATPPDIRLFLVRDKQAFHRSIQKLHSFPFDHVIIGHGSNIMGEGPSAFRKATAWLH